ncbi:hypothetical protein [Streptomyces flavidovirens]|uniref:ATP-binding protein n=1 Tax=Streptomyces flavidovirens TaxID=67298 RepID=A0ABW6RIN2_9ACTN
MAVSSGEPDAGVASGVRSGAVFDGEVDGIVAARLFATTFLQLQQAPADVIGSAQLVVSELVTNAFKYAPRPRPRRTGDRPRHAAAHGVGQQHRARALAPYRVGPPPVKVVR